MKRKSKTDWKRVDAMTDEEIDYSEIPELDEEWFDNAVWGIPTKEIMTIRIDRDVLAWFKSSGPRYQTRINALLRAYVDAQKRKTEDSKLVKKASKTVKPRKRA